MQTRRKGQFCFVLTLSPRLRAFLNKRTFDRRLNCNNSYFHIFRLFGFGKETVKITMCFCHDPVTITSYASYVIMCPCCFLQTIWKSAPRTTRGCHYSLFAWIPMKFCSDLPLKRCAGDHDWLSQILLLFLMQYEKVCTNLDARVNSDD